MSWGVGLGLRLGAAGLRPAPSSLDAHESCLPRARRRRECSGQVRGAERRDAAQYPGAAEEVRVASPRPAAAPCLCSWKGGEKDAQLLIVGNSGSTAKREAVLQKTLHLAVNVVFSVLKTALSRDNLQSTVSPS